MKPKIHSHYFLFLFLLVTSCSRNGEIENLDLIPVKMGENFQYINSDGEIIINPQFSNASVFRDGLALVRTSGENPKWGYINSNGKYIINPVYKSATIFSENIAFVVPENGSPTAINETGEIKFILKEVKKIRIFKDGLAAFTKHDTIEKWGFIDKNGTTVIKDEFNEVADFNENKCAVKNGRNKYGYIDKNGKTVINFQFDEASNFTDNRAIVTSNGKAGVIDENGKYIINPKFSAIYKDGNMYLFEQNRKWGWCDKNGKIVIKPQFETASKFNNNSIASVKSDGKYGYIDLTGKFTIVKQFDYASVFNNNLALVEIDGKIGFINSDGKYIINPQFEGYSYDYLSYINTGKSIFSEVETDYFDLNKVIEKVNLVLPEGLSFDTSYAQILSKFKIKSSDLNKYVEEVTIFTDKNVTSNTKISFQIVGKAFGVSATNEKIFMPQNKPDGFLYLIHLSGRALGKSKIIAENLKINKQALVKSGYIRDNRVYIYKNKDRQIVVTCEKTVVSIYILKNDYDLEAFSGSVLASKKESETSYKNGYD